MAVSGIYVTRGACLRYSPGMALIGYGRVSKRDQDPTAQRDLLTAAGCDELFIDKASGKLASRPQLDAAMRHLRAGDVLVITRLDRLGRSVKHLAALAVELQERKIGLRVLQQGIDTTTAVGRLFFHILAAIAEFERELIIERTVDGLDATRARGRKGGRKPTLTEAAVHQAQAMYLDFRTWLVVGGRHGMGGSPDAGRFLPALEEEHRSYAWATKWKLSGPTERSSVVRMAAALSWGPWTKQGSPRRPKPMALGPVHGPRCPAVAWKPGAGSKPRLRA